MEPRSLRSKSDKGKQMILCPLISVFFALTQLSFTIYGFIQNVLSEASLRNDSSLNRLGVSHTWFQLLNTEVMKQLFFYSHMISSNSLDESSPFFSLHSMK